MWASALLAQGLPPPKLRVAALLFPLLLFSFPLKVLPGSFPCPLSPAWHVVGLSAGSATVICRRLDIPGGLSGGATGLEVAMLVACFCRRFWTCAGCLARSAVMGMGSVAALACGGFWLWGLLGRLRVVAPCPWACVLWGSFCMLWLP